MNFSFDEKCEMKTYRPAALHTGKEWFISFYAYDPASEKLKRKRIKINYIKSITERRRYAYGLIRRININLEQGWNPFMEDRGTKAYRKIDSRLSDSCE